MSYYMFIASDGPLDYLTNIKEFGGPLDYWASIKEFEGPYIVEMIDRFLLDPEDFPETRGPFIVEMEDGFLFDNKDIPEISGQYTDKKYSGCVQFSYSDKIAKIIIQHIERQFEVTDEIELWGVWLGDDVKPVIKKCNLNDLTIEHIKDLWGDRDFYTPTCLKICKN